MARQQGTLAERLAQRMADRGVTQDSEARIEHIVQERQLKIVAASTAKARDRELAYLAFYLNWKTPGRGDLIVKKDSGQVPDREEMKRFIFWRTSLIEGPNIRACKTRSRLLMGWIEQLTNAEFQKKLWGEVLNFITVDLAEDEELAMTNEGRAKPIASLLDYKAILASVWGRLAGFRCARERLQFFFAVLCMVTGACRPGELTASSFRAAELDALKYKDVECYLKVTPDENGVERAQFFARVKHSRMKQSAQEGRWKSSLLNEEEPLLAAFDPTIPFLALAFDDDVFKLLKKPEDLEHIDPELIKRAGGKLVLDYEPEKLELIILREIKKGENGYEVSNEKCFTYASALAILDRLLKQLNYEPIFGRGFYILRRMYMNLLEMAGVKDKELYHTVGHAPGGHTFSKHYKSQLIGLDMQALMRGDQSRGDRREIEMGLQRRRGETTRLSLGQARALEDTDEIREVRTKLNENYGLVFAAYPTMVSAQKDSFPPSLEFRRLSKKLFHLRTENESKGLKTHQEAEYDGLVLAALDPENYAVPARRKHRASDEALDPAPKRARTSLESAGSSSISESTARQRESENVIDPSLIEEDRNARLAQVIIELDRTARESTPLQEVPLTARYPVELGDRFSPYPEEANLASSSHLPHSPSSRPYGEDESDYLWRAGGPTLTQADVDSIERSALDIQSTAEETLHDEQATPENDDGDSMDIPEAEELLEMAADSTVDSIPLEKSISGAHPPELAATYLSYQSHCDSNTLPTRNNCSSTLVVESLFPNPALPIPLSRSALIRAMSDNSYIARRGEIEEMTPKVGADGLCPVLGCDTTLSPKNANQQRKHIHDCLRQTIGKGLFVAWSRAIAHLEICPYADCKVKVGDDAKEFAEHLWTHVNEESLAGAECGIRMADGGICGEILGYLNERRVPHLEIAHGLIALNGVKGEIKSSGRLKFCFDCMCWVKGLGNIDAHAELHIERDLNWHSTEALSCQTDFRSRSDEAVLGLLRAKCSFCLLNGRLPAGSRWFSTRADGSKMAEHINAAHIFPLEGDSQCVFGSCEQLPAMSPSALAEHMETTHLVRLTKKTPAGLKRVPIPDGDLSRLLIKAENRKKIEKREEELDTGDELDGEDTAEAGGSGKGKGVAKGEKKVKGSAAGPSNPPVRIKAMASASDPLMRMTKNELGKELQSKDCQFDHTMSVVDMRKMVKRLRTSEPLISDRSGPWLTKRVKELGHSMGKGRGGGQRMGRASRDDLIIAVTALERENTEESTPGPATPRESSAHPSAVEILDTIDEDEEVFGSDK